MAPGRDSVRCVRCRSTPPVVVPWSAELLSVTVQLNLPEFDQARCIASVVPGPLVPEVAIEHGRSSSRPVASAGSESAPLTPSEIELIHNYLNPNCIIKQTLWHKRSTFAEGQIRLARVVISGGYNPVGDAAVECRSPAVPTL